MTIDTLSGSGVQVKVRRLKVGDTVRVRNPNEILATLDAEGSVDGLPFMPEMLEFTGQTFTVDAVTHRTCDTVKAGGTGGTTRRMERAVHLDGVRCDGSGHGGCQARCLIFWKEDWLEKVAAGGVEQTKQQPRPTSDIARVLEAASCRAGSSEDKPIYMCQATELPHATSFVSAHNPRMWVNDVRSGNATARSALAGIAVLALGKLRRATERLPRLLRVRSRRLWPELHPSGEKHQYPPLNLQPGELVEVRPKQEIEAILDPDDKRGPHFHAGMLLECGTRANVAGRVDRIIDERTGRMLKLRGDCVALEGVWCDGNRQALCRRKIYSFWREAWLRRVDNGVDRGNALSHPARIG